MVDARDLKSLTERCVGSSPSTPTTILTEIANKSTHPKHKHAAIVFHKGDLIGWANNNGNHHAEVRALEVAACYGYRDNLTLLSIRVSKGGTLKLAKPCVGCRDYCKRHGVTTIYYSNDKGAIVKLPKERE